MSFPQFVHPFCSSLEFFVVHNFIIDVSVRIWHCIVAMPKTKKLSVSIFLSRINRNCLFHNCFSTKLRHWIEWMNASQRQNWNNDSTFKLKSFRYGDNAFENGRPNSPEEMQNALQILMFYHSLKLKKVQKSKQMTVKVIVCDRYEHTGHTGHRKYVALFCVSILAEGLKPKSWNSFIHCTEVMQSIFVNWMIATLVMAI